IDLDLVAFLVKLDYAGNTNPLVLEMIGGVKRLWVLAKLQERGVREKNGELLLVVAGLSGIQKADALISGFVAGRNLEFDRDLLAVIVLGIVWFDNLQRYLGRIGGGCALRRLGSTTEWR